MNMTIYLPAEWFCGIFVFNFVALFILAQQLDRIERKKKNE